MYSRNALISTLILISLTLGLSVIFTQIGPTISNDLDKEEDISGGDDECLENCFSYDERKNRTDVKIETVYESQNGSSLVVIRNTGALGLNITENTTRIEYQEVENYQGADWRFIGDLKNSTFKFLTPQETLTIDTNLSYDNSANITLYAPYESKDTFPLSEGHIQEPS